jgi:antitoxin CptB
VSEMSRLRWLCRRGMKELDVLLSTYLARHFVNADEQSQQRFKELLEWPDPDLYALLTGRTSVDDPAMQAFVERLRRLKRDR